MKQNDKQLSITATFKKINKISTAAKINIATSEC
jgi:hypothetical protein